jgi:hypothetical protein
MPPAASRPTTSLYQELRVAIQGAEPFPNSGIPEAREAKILRPQVNQALGIP